VEKPAKPNAVAVIARAIILRDISNPIMLTVFIAFFWWLATNPDRLPPPASQRINWQSSGRVFWAFLDFLKTFPSGRPLSPWMLLLEGGRPLLG
jgi:hypothetical protein